MIFILKYIFSSVNLYAQRSNGVVGTGSNRLLRTDWSERRPDCRWKLTGHRQVLYQVGNLSIKEKKRLMALSRASKNWASHPPVPRVRCVWFTSRSSANPFNRSEMLPEKLLSKLSGREGAGLQRRVVRSNHRKTNIPPSLASPALDNGAGEPNGRIRPAIALSGMAKPRCSGG